MTATRRLQRGDAGLLCAELIPGKSGLFVGAGVVNFFEAHGLGVAAFGGDHGERLLAAGEGAGLKS